MDTYTDRSRKYVQVGIGSVHIRTMPNTSSLSPEMVSALPSVPQKTVRSFMKVKHSVGAQGNVWSQWGPNTEQSQPSHPQYLVVQQSVWEGQWVNSYTRAQGARIIFQIIKQFEMPQPCHCPATGTINTSLGVNRLSWKEITAKIFLCPPADTSSFASNIYQNE